MFKEKQHLIDPNAPVTQFPIQNQRDEFTELQALDLTIWLQIAIQHRKIIKQEIEEESLVLDEEQQQRAKNIIFGTGETKSKRILEKLEKHRRLRKK